MSIPVDFHIQQQISNLRISITLQVNSVTFPSNQSYIWITLVLSFQFFYVNQQIINKRYCNTVLYLFQCLYRASDKRINLSIQKIRNIINSWLYLLQIYDYIWFTIFEKFTRQLAPSWVKDWNRLWFIHLFN